MSTDKQQTTRRHETESAILPHAHAPYTSHTPRADTKHIDSPPSPTPQTSLFTFNPRFLHTPEPSSQQPSADSAPSSTQEDHAEDADSATSIDLWAQPDAVKTPAKPRFQTWDSFLVEGAAEPGNPYFSEAGPRVFDAALGEYGQGQDVGDVVRSDVFCTCLLHLGLGRSSVLFDWDPVQKEFRPVRPNLRISGCTAGTVESIVISFATTGKKIHFLTSYTSTIYASSPNPTAIALADCITSILEAIQTRLSIPPSTITSILHLHSLMREPALIINTFYSIITKTSGAKNDSVLLTRLFDVVQQEQHRSGWLKPLLMETLARVSRPWLGFLEEWIGLDRPVGGEGIGFEGLVERGLFVRVEEEMEVDERGQEVTKRSYLFDKRKVPSFTSAETAETIFESGKSLRFLQKFHPNHPLSKPGAVEGVQAPKLKWKFSWEDLENLQAQAKNYERQLQTAISRYSSSGGSVALPTGVIRDDIPERFEEFPTFGKSKEEIISMISHSVTSMNARLPPLETAAHSDALRHLVLSISRRGSGQEDSGGEDHLTTFAPPISITPMLSFSHLFAVQAKLINTACLRMFFREHQILSHLRLLRRFQLFGDGVFSSRLSHALFSDELDTTEKQPNQYRSGGTMGLKLGSRDTWPPGSSELRLALMGVLTDSFTTATTPLSGIYTSGKEHELPGNLSFAVRDMTPADLDKCMDPHSIAALDFLKLHYTPPAPLEAIITPTALYRYDRLFRLLLRIQRMLFVTTKLFRDATRRDTRWPRHRQPPVAQLFRIDAHHFVTTLAAHMFESGVAAPWHKFEAKLGAIDAALSAAGDDNDTAAAADLAAEGLERLRGYHESVLDRIMFATLTRKRQAPVMKLVEDVFVAVLAFARYSHERAEGRGGGMGLGELAELYKVFRRRVGIFLSVCRGLSEKRGCKLMRWVCASLVKPTAPLH
ncbi:Spc98 family-domain-containing protein [Morchella snyderi]|nr:Spc98 family-domain-containing protein [Morchella snyderi]